MKRLIINLIVLLGLSILLIGIIRYYYQKISINQNNQKIIKDLKTIKNNLILNLKLSDKLPDPNYTLDYYSGIKKGLYCVLKEPFLGRCYIYAKKENKFQIAGIIKIENGRKTIVTGNTDSLLIKDRKSNFLIPNGSTTLFPYNPNGNLSDGYIISCSGNIYINNYLITNCYNIKINNSDIVKVYGEVEILINDGRRIKISSIHSQPAIFKLKDKLYYNKNEDILLLIGKALVELGNFKIENPGGTYLIIKGDILKTYIKKNTYIIEKNSKDKNFILSYKILKNNLTILNNNNLKTNILSNNITLENLLILNK